MNNKLKRETHNTGKLTSGAILWSLTRGESNQQKGRCLAIDGISNVTHFLEQLEDSENSNINFLELRACDESCAGGVLISGNRFLTVERLNSRADNYSVSQPLEWTGKFDEKVHGLDEIKERSMLVMDTDRAKAIDKIKKVDELLKVLPGIDCSACGSPTCKSLAHDIVQGSAELSSCVFLQEHYIRIGKLTVEDTDIINAGIWGENRNYRSQSK